MISCAFRHVCIVYIILYLSSIYGHLLTYNFWSKLNSVNCSDGQYLLVTSLMGFSSCISQHFFFTQTSHILSVIIQVTIWLVLNSTQLLVNIFKYTCISNNEFLITRVNLELTFWKKPTAKNYPNDWEKKNLFLLK